MKEYYITWTEVKNNYTRNYIACVYGNSVKDVKEKILYPEQSERYRIGAPFMFHKKVSRSRPDDFGSRARGHFYY